MQSITTFEKFKKIDSKVQEDLSNNGVSIEKNITGLVWDDTTRSVNFYKDLTPIEHSDVIGSIQAKKTITAHQNIRNPAIMEFMMGGF